MSASPTLVLGTRNRKKGAELFELLNSGDRNSRDGGPSRIEVATLDSFADAAEVVEDGDSFAANAALKAVNQARHLRRWVLGEDSGIEVDALRGAPGIYSARFAGPRAIDEDNNRRLLAELEGIAAERRTARYVCHMTLCDPGGTIRAESEDFCRGRIRRAPAGRSGFGYDPLFEIVEYHRTFGELGPAVKQAISHRSRAARALLPQLRKLIEGGEWNS